jgi:superoxide reductase
MPDHLSIYKCETCGNIIEVVHAGNGPLKCCGKPMVLQVENTVDAVVEKHVPVMEKIDGGVKVKVGEVTHPMEDAHYIQWIEIIADGISYMRFLKPGDTPEATFLTNAQNITAREYCNLHGHWKG